METNEVLYQLKKSPNSKHLLQDKQSLNFKSTSCLNLLVKRLNLKLKPGINRFPQRELVFNKSLTVLMDRLHWQSLLAKLSATATRDSH